MLLTLLRRSETLEAAVTSQETHTAELQAQNSSAAEALSIDIESLRDEEVRQGV